MARIGIDIRKIQDFGVGTYIQNLLTHLSALDPLGDYYLFGYNEADIASLSLGPNFRFVREPSARFDVLEHISISFHVRRLRLNLFHSPHCVLPYVMPARPVITIHDIVQVLFPEYLPNRRAFYYARTVIGRSIRQAARVLTVSESSRRDILSNFDVDPAKVLVVHNGVEEIFFDADNPEQRARARQRYLLDSPYILYVGNIKPHKNVERLIAAFGRLKEREMFWRYKLVIIGSDAGRHPAIRRTVYQSNLLGEVRFLGWIPKEFLPAVYQMASCFVYPSLYEGFGLPPLEAMASGTPVICSPAASLKEVVGQASVLVDPTDVGAIAAAMAQVLTDQPLRADLVAKGRENASRFSWRSSASKVLECFRETLQVNGKGTLTAGVQTPARTD